MYKLFARKIRTAWFPGQAVIRDRWGEPQNRFASNREFNPSLGNPDETLRHMRWGLGLM